MKVQSPEKQRRKTKSFGKDPKYLLYKYNLIYIYNDYILYIHTLYISIGTSSVFFQLSMCEANFVNTRVQDPSNPFQSG